MRGVSVVPTMVWPFQGTTNSTRPSSVLGMRMASSPGRKSRGSVRCTPWLGATMVCAAGSSMRRTASTHTPVALTTHLARSVTRSSPSASATVTPSTRPSVRVRPTARA
ncbi:Uncharacterised protein [Bordetella pertussis]|nr:Uncharacterised protein [Bordetella pertussis]CFM30596.1 Uncharacterised protein [Bordetella pertussis]CFM89525.1 Uncharacterised protein [Bordetella pertussis]CFN08991.1 Uncharacterised protein [Bordetella pertussis]CFN39749.1 Uncharacterised protein [Bordetella pertussis]